MPKREKGIIISFKNMKTVTIALLIACALCFLLSFVRVSLWGFGVEASGFELATKISLHEELEFDEEDILNPWLIIALVCLGGGVGTAAGADEGNKSMRTAGLLAAAVVLCLFMFRITFESVNKVDGVSASLFDIEYCSGWILAVIASTISSLMAFLANNIEKITRSTPMSKASGTQSPASSPVGNVVQPQVKKPEIPLKSANPLKIIIKEKAIKTEEGAIWIPDVFPCFIGRDSSKVQVLIPDLRTSMVHAKLYIEQGAAMLSDEGSTNGTFVNGKRVSEPVELLTGDEVVIGDTTLFFEVSEQ